MPIVLREGDDVSVEFSANPPEFILDVRLMLEAGCEPYPVIMHCVAQLAVGEVLHIHTLFEPRPLLRQFARMGLQVDVHLLDPEHWIVSVRRREG